MRKLLVEFIGTFFLVFTVGMTCIYPGAGMLAPVAIGAVLMVMVYAGGHISGGHYNPAVSLGATIRGALPVKDLFSYWAAQILGALLASGVAYVLKGYPSIPSVPFKFVPALAAEFVGTFALVYTVLSTATTKKIAGNSFYGLAIGSSVMVMAAAVGGISGGAFNPAVAIGGAVMNLLNAGMIWVHIVAELAAGAIAAVAYHFINEEK